MSEHQQTPSGHHDHSHDHDHSHGHSHTPPRKPLHHDWRLWVGVGLMLAAIIAYVLSLNESLQPRVDQPKPPAQPAAGK